MRKEDQGAPHEEIEDVEELAPRAAARPIVARPQSGFPWLALLLLLGTIVLFWVLPSQMGKRPVQVEFSNR